MKLILAFIAALTLPSVHAATIDDEATRGNEANAPMPQQNARVVFMGDSITQGWGSQPFFKDNPDFVNKGVSGETAGQMLARFSADVIVLKPEVVHILGGTNDVAENAGPESDEQIQSYLKSMVELARANNIKVILGSIPPAADFPWHTGLDPAPRIQRINAWIKKYAKHEHLVYVDYWSALATADGALKTEYAPDGVHPNEQGYAAMLPLAAAAIEKALSHRN